jgi:hypothetical protein
MTPRERAIELIETIDNAGWGRLPLEAITIIKQAINSAIEEERKSRECCKHEREVCAKLGDEEAGYHAGEMERLRRNDLAVVIEEKAMKTAKEITRKIRARSESENNQQKGD